MHCNVSLFSFLLIPWGEALFWRIVDTESFHCQTSALDLKQQIGAKVDSKPLAACGSHSFFFELVRFRVRPSCIL